MDKSELKNEAISKLEGYLKSEVAGLLQQALDRVQAMGINTERVSRNRQGAENLLSHLVMWN